jgi:hypothetical protein
MLTLDCHTVDSIFESLSSITGVTRGTLTTFLQTIDLDSHYSDSSMYDGWPDSLVFRLFYQHFKLRPSFDATYWFHLTRVVPSSTFSEGILPLSNTVGRIWDMLRNLAGEAISDKEWAQFRSKVESGSLGHYSEALSDEG